jgi:serine/threonine protein kinase
MDQYVLMYKITDTILGSVWRASGAYNSRLKYVVKIADKEGSESGRFRGVRFSENIQREIAIMRFLITSHRIIYGHVRPLPCMDLIETFDTDTKTYIVTESGKCDVYTLLQSAMDKKQNIGNTPSGLPISTVLSIFTRMVTIIAQLHEIGVAHCDVSLENFVVRHGLPLDVAVIDFGLARKFNESSKFHLNCEHVDIYDGHVIGKVGYCDHRMMSSRPCNMFQHDTYALGICLFMLVFGSSPCKYGNSRDAAYCLLSHGKTTKLLTCYGFDVQSNPFFLDVAQCIDMLCIKHRQPLAHILTTCNLLKNPTKHISIE